MALWIKRHSNKGGLLPPQKPGDVGWDLVVSKNIVVPPNQTYPIDIPCDVSVKLPHDTWGFIIHRSGAARKTGLIMLPGVIDEGYTGQLYACCLNRMNKPIEVKEGDRLAQMILIRSERVSYVFTDELPKTDRGSMGFGSTDKRKGGE